MQNPRGNDVVVLHPAIALAGRVLFTLIFFLSGITRQIQTSFFLKGMAMTGAAL